MSIIIVAVKTNWEPAASIPVTGKSVGEAKEVVSVLLVQRERLLPGSSQTGE